MSSKKKAKIKGNFGSKQYRHLILRNNGQFVKAGTIIVIGNSNKLKAGENVYSRKCSILAKIDGIVEIKNKIVNIEEGLK